MTWKKWPLNSKARPSFKKNCEKLSSRTPWQKIDNWRLIQMEVVKKPLFPMNTKNRRNCIKTIVRNAWKTFVLIYVYFKVLWLKINVRTTYVVGYFNVHIHRNNHAINPISIVGADYINNLGFSNILLLVDVSNLTFCMKIRITICYLFNNQMKISTQKHIMILTTQYSNYHDFWQFIGIEKWQIASTIRIGQTILYLLKFRHFWISSLFCDYTLSIQTLE